jgi:hypothetical protein
MPDTLFHHPSDPYFKGFVTADPADRDEYLKERRHKEYLQRIYDQMLQESNQGMSGAEASKDMRSVLDRMTRGYKDQGLTHEDTRKLFQEAAQRYKNVPQQYQNDVLAQAAAKKAEPAKKPAAAAAKAPAEGVKKAAQDVVAKKPDAGTADARTPAGQAAAKQMVAEVKKAAPVAKPTAAPSPVAKPAPAATPSAAPYPEAKPSSSPSAAPSAAPSLRPAASPSAAPSPAATPSASSTPAPRTAPKPLKDYDPSRGSAADVRRDQDNKNFVSNALSKAYEGGQKLLYSKNVGTSIGDAIGKLVAERMPGGITEDSLANALGIKSPEFHLGSQPGSEGPRGFSSPGITATSDSSALNRNADSILSYRAQQMGGRMSTGGPEFSVDPGVASRRGATFDNPNSMWSPNYRNTSTTTSSETIPPGQQRIGKGNLTPATLEEAMAPGGSSIFDDILPVGSTAGRSIPSGPSGVAITLKDIVDKLGPEGIGSYSAAALPFVQDIIRRDRDALERDAMYALAARGLTNSGPLAALIKAQPVRAKFLGRLGGGFGAGYSLADEWQKMLTGKADPRLSAAGAAAGVGASALSASALPLLTAAAVGTTVGNELNKNFDLPLIGRHIAEPGGWLADYFSTPQDVRPDNTPSPIPSHTSYGDHPRMAEIFNPPHPVSVEKSSGFPGLAEGVYNYYKKHPDHAATLPYPIGVGPLEGLY